jgi:hypothetical protein
LTKLASLLHYIRQERLARNKHSGYWAHSFVTKKCYKSEPHMSMSVQEKVNTIFKHFVLIQKLSNLDEIIQVKSESCHVHLIFPEKQNYKDQGF